MSGPLQGMGVRSPSHGPEHTQTLGHSGHRCPSGQGAGRRGHGIAQVVAPGDVQLGAQQAVWRLQLNDPMVGLPAAVLWPHLGAVIPTKAPTAARAGQAPPHRGVRVIGRKYRHTTRSQGRQHAAVFFGHRGHAVHELLVLALGVVDQRHRGISASGKPGNFARVVHAQLQHGDTVVRAQAQQSQRHADVVIEITLRSQRIITLPCMQYGRQHLRHRGFAVAAGHCNQWQVKLRTPCLGQCLQSLQ